VRRGEWRKPAERALGRRYGIEIVSPGSAEVGNLHRRLLPTLGLAIGELFDFDALADRCAEDGRWTFLLAAVLMLRVEDAEGAKDAKGAVRT
jgi:hypothetical protein